MYSGFVSRISPIIDGNGEHVNITCLGYVSKLSQGILKNGTQIELKTDVSTGLTTGATASAAAASLVFKTIIDRYRVESVNPKLNYSATSVEGTGNTLSYIFGGAKYFEALDKCREACPSNWWWYVGADNILKLKPKNLKPTHTFVLGKDFKSIKVEKNMENVVNRVLFSSGSNPDQKIMKLYSDTTSSDLYDDRWEIITDNRVSLSTTADNIGQSTLAEKKDADVKTTVEIIDNNGSGAGYDIESINPGDTCSFKGFNDLTSQTFEDNMMIVAVDWTPDSVIIEVESLKVSAGREIIDNKKTLDGVIANGQATSYDTDFNGWHEIGSTDEPAFSGTWANNSSGYETAAFRKDINGYVHLKGMITGTGTTAFTLPVGYRPAKRVFSSNYSFNGSAQIPSLVSVLPTGEVNIYFGSSYEQSLDNVNFKAMQ